MVRQRRNVSEIASLFYLFFFDSSWVLTPRHALESHFWLNEGWTTYMERLLQQELHSPAHRGFAYLLGAKELRQALNDYTNKPKYQRLIIDFEIGEGNYRFGFSKLRLAVSRLARSGRFVQQNSIREGIQLPSPHRYLPS
jgi:hypothetical protein